MKLVRVRRIARLGQYVYPASCLVIGAIVWKYPPSDHLFVMLAIGAGVLCMWGVLRIAFRWLEDATAEQSRLGKELIQSQKVLALGEISTGIAHEINNPLNIILREVELLRTQLDAPPSSNDLGEIRDSLDSILGQVERCSEITHKLLDFARHRRPVSQFADINLLMEDMLSLVERESGTDSIWIVRAFDDLMPMVKTDPPLLRQVFLNLLINAVQAMGKSGVIFVSTYCEDGMACVEVRDTGPGISPDDIKRIFNPFYTTKPPGDGTGLGLSVSLRIINELGGSLCVKSDPGEGATFTVRIPIDH
ncbi:two-component sensor histidine kinase [Pseudodesulfovibrio sp. JC047]|uniref:sensor histidine kinase n=1 Tax=Pseudodesulfovibrio sp. JC047 TaxID=2683199 RepID=UPI0013D4EDEC|nr:ATP-binding protein [Pseudodesulfovibrio sp. JC047]NDV19863.1 two-component sensor histidine kinase [Pseudodesulfovibrio sp. JC047]